VKLRLYAELSPDLVVDPDGDLRQIEPLLDDGRRQVDDSGHMATAGHWTESVTLGIPVRSYIDLQLSYAHIAALTPGQRNHLAAGIRDVLQRSGNQPAIGLTVRQYTVASQPVR
jgi:hypothetical protein